MNEATTKGHILLYDSIYVEGVEQINPQRQKINWWLPRAGREGEMRSDSGHRVCFRWWRKCYGIVVMMVAQLCENPKKALKKYFKRVSFLAHYPKFSLKCVSRPVPTAKHSILVPDKMRSLQRNKRGLHHQAYYLVPLIFVFYGNTFSIKYTVPWFSSEVSFLSSVGPGNEEFTDQLL